MHVNFSSWHRPIGANKLYISQQYLLTQKVSTYYKAGNKLISNVKSAYNATTDGSGQNLELLAEGSANVAFVQGDVYNHWINSHPQFADKFTVIVTDRTEHVQLIMRDGMTEDDIQKKKRY